MPLTQDKIKTEEDKSPVEPDVESDGADLESEDAISDFVEDSDSDKDVDGESITENGVQDKEDDPQVDGALPEKEDKPEKPAEPSDSPYSGLEEMRKGYEGFSKEKINEPDEADKAADDKTIDSAMDMEAENVGDIATNVSKLMGDENTAAYVGEVIKGSYQALKAIISKIKESKEDDEDKAAKKKGFWEKTKDFLAEHKDKLMKIGELIISKVPILRSILSAFKMITNMVKFFIINGTRTRMADQRRKFKEKYAGKEENGKKFVEESSGFISWAKQKIGVKKTNQTVNEDLVKQKYTGGKGTKEALKSKETKDMRQYLIDDKLMKLNKSRQVKKGKDAAFDGLGTAINIMNDVAAFASLGASEAGTSVLGFLFNSAGSDTADMIDAGKGIAEKALGLAELKISKDEMKEAVDYTGMLLEHIGSMNPYSEESQPEFEHVDSDIDATGVDKQELYKNNGKKKEQKKLLIEALAE